MQAMSRKGAPEDERIHKLAVAKMVNQSLGGIVITPWEVDDLPQDWIDFFISLNTELPRMTERQLKIDKVFREFEQNHPQYGKRQ